MIPQKNKISINLMESIDSETSLDSPDREFANFDLNDFDEAHELTKDEATNEQNDPIDKNICEASSQSKTKPEINTVQIKAPRLIDTVTIPQIKVPKLELLKAYPKLSNSEETDANLSAADKHEAIESKTNSRSDSLDIGPHSKDLSSQNRIAISPQYKTSPNLSINSNIDLKSPRSEVGYLEKSWPSSFKPASSLNKAIIAPQIKSSDTNIHKVTSPRLDGLILSQSKSGIKGSDNVVVMYQFETNSIEENSHNHVRKSLNDSARDMMERTKADERRRLELTLQKELEEIRGEWASKERRLKAELLEVLREAEEKFAGERRKRLAEQAERHRRELEEVIFFQFLFN